jgi:hypothetical protein
MKKEHWNNGAESEIEREKEKDKTKSSEHEKEENRESFLMRKDMKRKEEKEGNDRYEKKRREGG